MTDDKNKLDEVQNQINNQDSAGNNIEAGNNTASNKDKFKNKLIKYAILLSMSLVILIGVMIFVYSDYFLKPTSSKEDVVNTNIYNDIQKINQISVSLDQMEKKVDLLDEKVRKLEIYSVEMQNKNMKINSEELKKEIANLRDAIPYDTSIKDKELQNNIYSKNKIQLIWFADKLIRRIDSNIEIKSVLLSLHNSLGKEKYEELQLDELEANVNNISYYELITKFKLLKNQLMQLSTKKSLLINPEVDDISDNKIKNKLKNKLYQHVKVYKVSDDESQQQKSLLEALEFNLQIRNFMIVQELNETLKMVFKEDKYNLIDEYLLSFDKFTKTNKILSNLEGYIENNLM